MSTQRSKYCLGKWIRAIVTCAAYAGIIPTQRAYPAEVPSPAEVWSLMSTGRVVFLGDSITYSGQYIEFLEAALRLKSPSTQFDFLNLGLPSETVSGLSEPGHAGGQFPRPALRERMRRVMSQAKPQLVVACYGMNDGIYFPFDESRFAAFREGLEGLRREAEAGGARVLHLTPPVFDPIPLRGKTLPAGRTEYPMPFEGYDRVLERYGAWLISQDRLGWAVADIHGPMSLKLTQARAQHPAFLFAADGVHLNQEGHWMITQALLRFLGFEPWASASSAEEAMARHPRGPKVLELVQSAQRMRKDAWLTGVGHLRPGMNKGVAIALAEEKRLESDRQISELLARQASILPTQHWAFAPVVRPALPRVTNHEWPRESLDLFILARLESQGLRPAPAASRRQLLRRASYDLTGLPPSIDEIEAFEHDASPGAWDRVVDRLLSSPRYGERWARYWLDVARFADTKGYVYSDREEPRFIHAHVYRDWVIRALNQDLPYDQFLKLQIAADQIPSPPEDLAAMGFMTLGRRFLGVVHDIIDDRIDTLTRATQGLTVSCARCHDHKFDPIPTQDYYSLYGIFSASFDKVVPVLKPGVAEGTSRAFMRGLHERETKLQRAFEKRRSQASDRFQLQASNYLAAVLEVEKLPTEEFYEIRGEDDLNPVIVRQWQAFLERRSHPADPVFGPWTALSRIPADQFKERAETVLQEHVANQGGTMDPILSGTLQKRALASMKEVASVYGDLFARAERSWRPLARVLTNASPEIAASLASLDGGTGWEAFLEVLHGADSPTRVPSGSVVEIEWFFDEAGRVELARLQKEIDLYILNTSNAAPYAVVLEDRQHRVNAKVFKRGNPATKGEEVPRRYLELVEGASRKSFLQGSGRLELAEAIVNPHNPLTARVMVNRIWMHHFGMGLVKTPSDFGVRAEAPSHPELLDWLASRFMEQGWSLKQLHRDILKSATYQQSAQAEPTLADRAGRLDPENRLLWKFNRQRLDFESMRDALICVSDGLDLTMGGRAVDLFQPPFSARRSVYGFVDRQFVPSTLRWFDVANPDAHSPRRSMTTVPQQALFFLNSPFVQDRARSLVRHLEEIESGCRSDMPKADQLYRIAMQRHPSAEEREWAEAFLHSAAADPVPIRVMPRVSQWQYGYAEIDLSRNRIEGFAPLPHFSGKAWQGGESYPDGKLGWLQLTATGGHVGNDLKHAVVRRWVSPIRGRVQMESELEHRHAEGDGVRAHVISSRHGLLGRWEVRQRKQEVRLGEIEVEMGDSLDFVVDHAGNLLHDDFLWAPVLHQVEPAPVPGWVGAAQGWSALTEFIGPQETPIVPLNPWEQLAQVLLLSNEFVFVD